MVWLFMNQTLICKRVWNAGLRRFNPSGTEAEISRKNAINIILLYPETGIHGIDYVR